MFSRNGTYFLVVACLLLLSTGRLAADEKESASQRCLKAIAAFVESGQNRRASEEALRWAAEQDADREVLAQACALLSNKQIFEGALVLLKRLDWKIPAQCSWPMQLLGYMQKQGMNAEIDRALLWGTALLAKPPAHGQNETDQESYRWGANPATVTLLWDFYQTNRRLEELWPRYEQELTKRPHDAALITEFAWGLARHDQPDRAAAILRRLDLDKLDLLTLIGLGGLWYPPHNPTNLVQWTIRPLELALTHDISDADAQQYTSGSQVMIGPELAKRLIRERLLCDLGDRYAFLGQVHQAKDKYAAYLALPQREHWGDRTKVQQKFAQVLKALALPDQHRQELEQKARASGSGVDWAELAAYLQGQADFAAAKSAWEKAIVATPPVTRRGKVEDKRRHYVRQFIAMLDAAKLYAAEIAVLKQSLQEGPNDYERIGILESVAQACLKLGKKNEALAFLTEQLDQKFDIELVQLIIRADHEKTLFDYHSIGHAECKKLPTWNQMIAKIKALGEPQRSRALAEFYRRYDLYAEYVDLVESWPKTSLTWSDMDTLMDHAHRCNRPTRTVVWGQEILRHIGEKGFPIKGDREYINTLEDVSEYSADAGDFDTSLTFTKQLCLLVPERFYFAEALAKLAVHQNKQEQLTGALKKFAAEHPGRWVIWAVLADVYGIFGNQTEQAAAAQKAAALK